MNHFGKEELDLVKEMQDRCKFDQQQRTSTRGQKSNNNDEDFEDEYDGLDLNQPVSSGRVSGGSRESAFSSASEIEAESSQVDSSSSDTNSLSGRSSANRDSSHSLEDVKTLNSHCNIVPGVREALAMVDSVRVRFLDSLKEDVKNSELYDNLDIDELNKPLPAVSEQEQSLAFRLISRYFNFQKILSTNPDQDQKEKEINAAIESLKELLKFRQHYQLSKVLPDQFSREFYILNGIFPFGHDRQHVPVLYIRARVHRRWSHLLDDTFRRYVAWQIDVLTKSYHGAKVSKTVGYSGLTKDGSFGICFDCLNVSYSCLDMDFLRFLVRILVHCYPTYCRYALCLDQPWIFRSVWNLVRTWLPEEARNTVQLITSKQLTDFIDGDQIPNCIKINNLKASDKPASGKHKLPKSWDSIKGIEEFAKDLSMNANEVKQFKAHVEKFRKEYDQLGAL